MSLASVSFCIMGFLTLGDIFLSGATERVLLCFSARQNLPDCIMPRKTVPEFDFLSGTRTLFTILVVYGHRWRMNVQAPLHDVTPYEEVIIFFLLDAFKQMESIYIERD